MVAIAEITNKPTDLGDGSITETVPLIMSLVINDSVKHDHAALSFSV